MPSAHTGRMRCQRRIERDCVQACSAPPHHRFAELLLEEKLREAVMRWDGASLDAVSSDPAVTPHPPSVRTGHLPLGGEGIWGGARRTGPVSNAKPVTDVTGYGDPYSLCTYLSLYEKNGGRGLPRRCAPRNDTEFRLGCSAVTHKRIVTPACRGRRCAGGYRQAAAPTVCGGRCGLDRSYRGVTIPYTA